jgi:hypothetical protein
MLKCWNPLTKVATIAAQVDERRVLCRISMEVLQKKFHASTDEPMRAVSENRSVLQAKDKNVDRERSLRGRRLDHYSVEGYRNEPEHLN